MFLLLLAGCQAPAIGPDALEGALRLPDIIGGYRRAAPPVLLVANGALAGSFHAYQQLGGPGRGVVEVPEAPQPGGAAMPESPEFVRAFELELQNARSAAAGRQASLTVRGAAIIRRDGEAMLGCWQLQTSEAGPSHIVAHCMGVVVDRYVQVVVRTADTPGEWQAAMAFAVGALSALRAGRAGLPERGDRADGMPATPPPGWRLLPNGRGGAGTLRL